MSPPKPSSPARDPFPLPSISELNEALGDTYEVIELTARGGMGAIYKARQPRLNRLVAIKVLAPRLPAPHSPGPHSPGDRFLQEAHSLARLSHPNIVAIHDSGQTPAGLPFIVMEYVDGTDLQTLIRTQKIHPSHSFAWINQICAALVHAHAQGMIHRDIKPANILISRQGEVKVADFGLAHLLATDHSPKSAPGETSPAGSPDFIAPEILLGREEPSPRSDIYSLGALIYQLLTGKTPRGLWEPPSTLNPGLDPRFNALVDLALQPDPALRYQDVRDLEADLHEIAFSSPDGLTSRPALSPRALLLRLTAVFTAMLAAQLIGSAFNIWYNLNHLKPLFATNPGQWPDFLRAIQVCNAVAYPPLIALWAVLVFSLPRLPRHSVSSQRRILNLPWWALAIAATGWLLTIPGILLQVTGAPPAFYSHLPVSVAIGAAIALSLGFLSVDLLCQNLLYPHFFSWKEQLWRVPGTLRLSLAGRGLFWTVSAAVCPILAMLLLVLSSTENPSVHWFAIAVAAVCVTFGLGTAWLLSKLIIAPVNQLRQAAQQIGQGNLQSRVEILRADELGILGHEFNRMAAGLREREHLRLTLGASIREESARQWLPPSDPPEGSP